MWEYLVEFYPDFYADTLQNALNRLGVDWWELVAIHVYGGHMHAIFKRPLP